MAMINDPVIIYLIAVVACMLFSAFFSGAETALLSSNVMIIETLSMKGNRRAMRSMEILGKMESAIGMILIGNNIVNIAAAAFLTFIAAEFYFIDLTHLLLLTIVQTIIFLVLCELLPKVFARSKAESYLLFFSLPLKLFLGFFYPATKISLVFISILKKTLKVQQAEKSRIRRDEIDMLFKIGGEVGVVGVEDHVYVSEVLGFKNTLAVEIMTPTIDITSLEIGSSMRQLVELIAKTNFTRIPVYRDRVDNIAGYVFYRDLMNIDGTVSIVDVMHKAHFIPETKNIYDLYMEMQENLLPIVFVVNEYGAVVGMVSYEDIAEEVVGEIQARDQSSEELIIKLSPVKFMLRGDLDIDYFLRVFKLRIDKKGFKTVGGFIMYMLGKIPKKGDRLEYQKYIFVIDEATERSVEKVVLHLPRQMR
jgi:putative hemolysin